MRVAGSRNWPRTAEVKVFEPGLRIPRIDIHKCSHSITTIDPRAPSISVMASAIWVVSALEPADGESTYRRGERFWKAQ